MVAAHECREQLSRKLCKLCDKNCMGLHYCIGNGSILSLFHSTPLGPHTYLFNSSHALLYLAYLYKTHDSML